MGTDLKKQFLAFERLIDPAALADIKRQTNDWEAEYAALGRHAEPRPLNLDPGYITPAKLVLASTKDHAHRIYLRDGIYRRGDARPIASGSGSRSSGRIPTIAATTISSSSRSVASGC